MNWQSHRLIEALPVQLHVASSHLGRQCPAAQPYWWPTLLVPMLLQLGSSSTIAVIPAAPVIVNLEVPPELLALARAQANATATATAVGQPGAPGTPGQQLSQICAWQQRLLTASNMLAAAAHTALSTEPAAK